MVSVGSEFTIVLPDSCAAAQICGTNDSNIKLIESHLGLSVFTRGNELSIDTDDDAKRQQFKFIIDRILDELSEAEPVVENPSDLILSIRGAGLAPGGGQTGGTGTAISIPGSARRVYPRTRNQRALVAAFRRSDVVFAVGPAGSGKTFLAVAEALRLVLSKKIGSIVLTRPVVEAGESLGFLPGSMEEKINPYLRPLHDSIRSCIPRETARRLTENGAMEVAPLAYMRGRTLSNVAVILDEAQNTTREQMKMFLTRMGENAKAFITGDITQTDLPKRVGSGLVHALSVLRGVPEIAVVELGSEDVVRSALARKIVQAYENEQNAGQ